MIGLKKNKKILLLVLCVLIGTVALIIGTSYGSILENDVEVAPNSELTYYLDIMYDGIDRNGVNTNSSNTVAFLYSDYIYVTDKIPDGLTFTGFITTSDGTIGAVSQNDENTQCVGSVIDDTHEEFNDHGTWNSTNTEYTYHGLHYDSNTRIVSFKVNRLQAGCKLTVGIKTMTPETVDDPLTTDVVEKRRDFYNYASLKEGPISLLSNIVHAYMMKGDVTTYQVSYQYTGTVPSNAPSPPGVASYAENAKVNVNDNVDIEGYTFSGWTTSDATVSNGSFTMPDHNVVFTGSFTEKTKYSVTYTITGDSPEGYVTPLTRVYYQDATVKVDSLKEGDVINGYRFLGWGSSDVEITSDGNFVMPNHNVTIVGRFELITYTVTYAFFDTVLPPNSDSILPPDETHRPGDIVSLPTISEPTGYRFLGWYKENNFIMPDNNITIYGEWARQSGTFEPTIVKEVAVPKKYYAGEKVRFNITVTNTANFAIHDVVVRENNEHATFVEGTGYIVQSDHYAKINSIAANSSITIYSEYVVQTTDRGRVINEVELVGALADNYYILYDKEYKATAEFGIKSKITICKTISGPSVTNTFQFHITGTSFDTWMPLLEDECKSTYVDPGTYVIKEIIPQEYEITNINGLSSNGANLNVIEGNDYTITFTNRFRGKGFYHSFGRLENTINAISLTGCLDLDNDPRTCEDEDIYEDIFP